MEYRLVDCRTEKEREDARILLQNNGLSFEEKVDRTIGIYDNEALIATGSIYENVIKMIAVDAAHKGKNLTGVLLSHLIALLGEKRISKYFLFTTPENKSVFLGFSFSIVVETDQVVMMENNVFTIEERLNTIKSDLNLSSGRKAAIVMNCNPVTNGHMYLIEKCASENDHVIIFLVEEDKSFFPFSIRHALLKKATEKIKNVHIVPSTQYIISAATFPTYFMKEMSQTSLEHMKVDIAIFKRYFMDVFNIDKRYVGDEPLDYVTNEYNKTMKTMLGDRLVIVDRLTQNEDVVSASLVRKLAKNGQFDKIKAMVPPATYRFLTSKEGRILFDNRKNS